MLPNDEESSDETTVKNNPTKTVNDFMIVCPLVY